MGIVPLAQLISSSVEAVSDHLGDQWGGCLNATCGNLVELVIAISALTGGLYQVVLDGLRDPRELLGAAIGGAADLPRPLHR